MAMAPLAVVQVAKMAEPPPRGGAPELGGEAQDRAPETGASDPLFHPPNLKRRSTVMGLAPAPHVPPPPMGQVQRDLPPPPAFGATTLLMGPQTPHIPLTLPAQTPPSDSVQLPPSADWEVASEARTPSASRVLVEPARSPASVRPPSGRIEPQRIESIPPQRIESIPPQRIGSIPPQRIESIPPQRIESIPPQRIGSIPPQRGGASEPAEPHRVERTYRGPDTQRMQRVAPRASIPAPPTHTTPTGPPVQVTTTLAVRLPEPPHAEPGPRHFLTGPLDERLVLLSDPDSARAASFRVLRDALLGKSMPRVLAVTSAAPRDGKTTCAINLALALSEQSATRVLLVDANFFEPELARIFNLARLTPLVSPDEPWLVPYRLAAVTASLHVAGITGPKGRFEQSRFEALIDRLCRASYDYLVIDTPALRGSPAVTTLVSGADAAILAVRSGGATTGRELRRAAEQIPANKALGVALIDATTHDA